MPTITFNTQKQVAKEIKMAEREMREAENNMWALDQHWINTLDTAILEVYYQWENYYGELLMYVEWLQKADYYELVLWDMELQATEERRMGWQF